MFARSRVLLARPRLRKQPPKAPTASIGSAEPGRSTAEKVLLASGLGALAVCVVFLFLFEELLCWFSNSFLAGC
jgi:hypothetical protein